MKPVKDDICVTPLIYDPQDFTPRRGITIFFSPEVLQDANITNEEKFKESLVEKFKKALDNPDEYKAKEKRVILMRGLMNESVETPLPKSVEIEGGVLNIPTKKQFVRL
jgi:hypothetical protein